MYGTVATQEPIYPQNHCPVMLLIVAATSVPLAAAVVTLPSVIVTLTAIVALTAAVALAAAVVLPAAVLLTVHPTHLTAMTHHLTATTHHLTATTHRLTATTHHLTTTTHHLTTTTHLQMPAPLRLALPVHHITVAIFLPAKALHQKLDVVLAAMEVIIPHTTLMYGKSS